MALSMRPRWWDFKSLNSKLPDYKINGRLVNPPPVIELVELRSTGRTRTSAPTWLLRITRPGQCSSAALAFQRLFAAHVDFDLLGLGFGLLGQLDLQHALFVVRGDILGVHRVGQREGAGKAAILPLDAAVVLFFLFLLELALAVTVRVLFSMRTSMSFSSIPGTSIFRVTLCSSS